MEIDAEILRFDTPTRNGHIYTKEAIDKAIEKLNGKPLYVTIPSTHRNPTTLELDEICASIDLSTDENTLKGKTVVMQTQAGQVLTSLIHADVKFDYGIRCIARSRGRWGGERYIFNINRRHTCNE